MEWTNDIATVTMHEYIRDTKYIGRLLVWLNYVSDADTLAIFSWDKMEANLQTIT